MDKLNWEWIRWFIALSEHGSINKAAASLGVSQPTLSRNLATLEHQLELSLFKRSNQGIEISEHGLKLLDAARQMSKGADQILRTVQGSQQDISGTIRISVNEIIAFYVMPRLISEFRRLYPRIQIELVVSNSVSSLSKREADLAIRMFAPTQPDFVAKKLPDLPLSFYASHDYIALNGEPKTPEQLLQHSLIGFDQSTESIEAAARLGWKIKPENFAIRCDNLLVSIQLLLSGAGVLATHKGLAQQYRQIKELEVFKDTLSLEYWLVCHHDVHTNPRIRLLMNYISEQLSTNPYNLK
ncbi:LysR family transcriptional regulator [Alginatibacterium sediminis]|uniref:LysR family transcriptional regulator n=1 Tax=Alginatibacterium sediminis TaxID=2164068 RepID=A0A420EGW8_9ALTE|nr:LysR family transcriptional regulator [Alginatibacterium sediminis]RKF19910.1 LysR family transcriptional regulator [Alginatibacterium sediminis]